MPISLSLFTLGLFGLLVRSAHSLLTVSGSQCASACGNISSTSGDEITCLDSEYASSTASLDFEACINCQLNSTAIDLVAGTSDLQWLLYNLRFTMSYCLWGDPASNYTLDTPCVTNPACGLLQPNIQFDSLATNASEYGYCANIDNAIIPKCTACLEELGNEYYLNNFFTALVAGCDQQPAPGSTLSLSGTLFSTTPVNLTSASSIPTYTSSHTHGLTKGGQIGVAVGCICLALALAGFLIVCFGKRRRRRELARIQQAERNGGDYISTQSITTPQTPYGWQHHQGGHYPQFPDDSPASATAMMGHTWPPNGEKQFSPYSSQYSSPVDGAGQWAHGQGQGQGAAVGLGLDAKVEQEEGQDAIEMQKINEQWVQEAAQRGFTTAPPPPPVLRHPGMGRGTGGEETGTLGKAI